MSKTPEMVVAEITALRERIQQQYPAANSPHPLPLADLLPLFHARDAAEGKVAAIGKVNPRPPGPLNALIQFLKLRIARALNWFVRDQVDFNYASVRAITEVMEALNAVNRSLVAAGGRLQSIEQCLEETQKIERAVEDLRIEADTHLRFATDTLGSRIEELRTETVTLRPKLEGIEADSARLRVALDTQAESLREESAERKESMVRMQEALRLLEVAAAHREREEIRLLRTLADVQNAFMQRMALLDQELKATIEQRVRVAEERGTSTARNEIAGAVTRIESQVHDELRVLRQRVGAILAREEIPQGTSEGRPANGDRVLQAASAITAPEAFFDSLRFSERFRGPEEEVREKLRMYVPRFLGEGPVLDLGCGRGEFLGLLREAGVEATGVEASPELVRLVSGKGLHAVEADLFAYLDAQPSDSVGGIFCAHVIEHMPPSALLRLIASAQRVLRQGGLLAFETPNPACLAIFATYFFLDPTHVRPAPSEFVSYLLQEAGFLQIEVRGLHAAETDFPGLKPLPDAFRQQFFGFLDYCVFARKAHAVGG